MNSLYTYFLRWKNNILFVAIFFLFYGAFALFFTLKTNITDHPVIITDICFSFDTPILSKNNFIANDSHPLLGLMLKPLFFIASQLVSVFGTIKAKSVFLALMSSLAIAISLLNVFRYLIDVIELKYLTSCIIIAFYSLFSTNFILAFSFESYPYSILFLTFAIYYYSRSIKKNEPTPLFINIALSVILGGITITNYIKGVIPVLFESGPFAQRIKKLAVMFGVFLCICLWMEYSHNIFFQAKLRVSAFSPWDLSVERVARYTFDWFWGAPVFLSQISKSFLSEGGIGITCEFYHYWWQYLFVGVLAVVCVYGWLANYREKLVYIPVLFFAVDIFIHVVCRFGINESFIYGGHWVFIIPILMGWGYKSFFSRRKHEYWGVVILLVLLLSILLNNSIQMINFGRLAVELFPVS